MVFKPRSPAPHGGPGNSNGSIQRRRHRLRLFGILFVVAGVLVMGIPGAMLLNAIWQENQLTQQWVTQVEQPTQHLNIAGANLDTAGGTTSSVPVTASKKPPSVSAAAPNIAFAMRVPRLNYFAAVRQGVSLGVLFAGPGHYPNTAMPGQEGNVGIAAHNTYWIAFGVLKPGDQVLLETRYGTFTYQISGSAIVSPTDRTVLAQTTDHRLTLTTCWPLWAGALATKRLVFFATEVAHT